MTELDQVVKRDLNRLAAAAEELQPLLNLFARGHWTPQRFQGLQDHSEAIALLCEALDAGRRTREEVERFTCEGLLVPSKVEMLRLIFETARGAYYTKVQWEEVVRDGAVILDDTIPMRNLLVGALHVGINAHGCIGGEDNLTITGRADSLRAARLEKFQYRGNGQGNTQDAERDFDCHGSRVGVSGIIAAVVLTPDFLEPGECAIFSGVTDKTVAGDTFYPCLTRRHPKTNATAFEGGWKFALGGRMTSDGVTVPEYYTVRAVPCSD